MHALEELITMVIEYLVLLTEACGAVIIVLGVIRAFVYHLRHLFSLEPEHVAGARLPLIESLVVGLGFQVAADVLKTAISPTWNSVLFLAAIVAVRAVLGFLLEREKHSLYNQEAPVGHQAPPLHGSQD
jgi:uncharacterized membrane protein